METRHTLHRALRSGGTTRRQQPLRERGRSRSAKLPVGKIKEKEGTDTDKLEDVDESLSTGSTTEHSNDDTAKSSPQTKKTQNEPKPVASHEPSKSPLSKRKGVRDRTPGLTLRGRSIHSLKSRVDWSRNAELSPEQSVKSSAVSEDDQASATSSVSLRSKSTESPSQSPAAKILDTPSPVAAGRLKSVRLVVAGRSRQNSPSHSPAARVKSTSSGRTSPAIHNDSTHKESAAASTAMVQTTEQVKKQGRLTGRSSTSTENSAMVTPPVRKLVKASTRSQSAPRLVETDDKKPTTVGKLVTRQVKELRSTPPTRRLRTSSSSPVTRTRPGAPRGRLSKPNLEKPDDSKNVKDPSTPAPVVNIREATDLVAAGDEVEGDADSVTRPPVCSSSSPESDHNYAKPEVADEPSSCKVAVVGKTCGNEGSFSEAGLGGGDTGVKDDLEAEVSGDCFKAKRVLRGRLKYLDVSKQTTVKEVMESSPKVSSGKGFIGEEALHCKESEPGKVTGLRRVAFDPPKPDNQEKCSEKETEKRGSFPSKVLRGTKRIGPPSSKIRKPLLQTLRQRKSNSKYMLQMIKSTLSQESKSSKGIIQIKQSITKDKSLTKHEKHDDDVLPALTDIKLPRTSFADRKPERNLFEQFSRESVSDSHKGASFSAIGSQDVVMSVIKEKEKKPEAESTKSAAIKSGKSRPCNNDLSSQEEIEEDQGTKLKIERLKTNKQQLRKQTRSKIHTNDATQTCIDPDTEKRTCNDNLQNTNSTRSKADGNRTENSRASKRLSRYGSSQNSVGNLQRNAELKGEHMDTQYCTSTPIPNDCKQTDTIITQIQLGTPENTNKGEEGVASLGLCLTNDDASESSIGYQDTSHLLGPNREPVTVSEDGRDGKSEVKLGTRKLRGLKQGDSPAETPIHSHLTTKSSLYRRPLQRTDKSVSQGPGGEAEASRKDDDSTNDAPDADKEEQPPTVRTRAGRQKGSGRTRPITTGSLPLTDLKDLSATDKVNKHGRRSSLRRQPSATQDSDTPSVNSEPVIEKEEDSTVTKTDVRKTRKITTKTVENEEVEEKLDLVKEPHTKSASDSVASDPLVDNSQTIVAPEPTEIKSTEVANTAEEKRIEMEPAVKPLVQEATQPGPVIQERRRAGRHSLSKVDEEKKIETESAVEPVIETTRPGPVIQKRRLGRPALLKVSEEKKMEAEPAVEPVVEETTQPEPVIQKRRLGRPAVSQVEEKKVEAEPAVEPVAVEPVVEEPVVKETAQPEPVIQKRRLGRPAVSQVEEKKVEAEPAVKPVAVEPVVEEPVVEETAQPEPVIQKRRLGRPAVSQVEEKKIEAEPAVEPVAVEPVTETTQPEPVIQKRRLGRPALLKVSEEKKIEAEPAVEPVVEETTQPEPVIQKRRLGRPAVSQVEEKKVEAEPAVEPVAVEPVVEEPVVEETAQPEPVIQDKRRPGRPAVPKVGEEKKVEVEPVVEPEVEPVTEKITDPEPVTPEKRRPGRPAKKRRLRSVQKETSSDSEPSKENAITEDTRETISIATENNDQDKNVDRKDSVPSNEAEKEELQKEKGDNELGEEAIVESTTTETVSGKKVTNVAIHTQEEQVSQDTFIPPVVKRSRGRPKRVQAGAIVVSETAAQASLEAEHPKDEAISCQVSDMNEELLSSTNQSEVLKTSPEQKQEEKPREEMSKADEVKTVVVPNAIMSNEQMSTEKALVPEGSESDEKAVELKVEVSTSRGSPDHKRRGRGRPRKHTVSVEVEVTKPPLGKEDNTEVPSRPVPRWKIPPPSPIRTRRLSRETVVSRTKIGLAEIAERIKQTGQKEAEESLDQVTQDPTDEVSTTVGKSASDVPTQPQPETLPDARVEQAVELDLKTKDDANDASTVLEIHSTELPALFDQTDSTKDVIQNVDSGAGDIETVRSKSCADLQGPPEPPVQASADEVVSLHIESQNITEPSAPHDALAEQQKESAEAPESTSSTALVLEKSTPSTVILQGVSQPFTTVDELQVPFHDTDEAELSEILTQKDQDPICEEPDDGDGLKLYLEVESNQSDEVKELVANGAQEVTNEAQERPSEEDVTATKILLPLIESKPAATADNCKQAQELRSVDAAKELEENCTQKEDTEVESILAKGNDVIDSNVKEDNGQPTDMSVENSPSKSEWCARKVTTGMKIVLKLKRKGSSERSETNSPSTPTLADQKPHAVSPSTTEVKEVKVDDISKGPEIPLSGGATETNQNTPSVPVSEAAPGNEELRKKRKRRRNELEMLSVIDRAKRKCVDDDANDSEVSGFTSDSTHATQSSTTEKESALKSLDVKDDVKIEPKEEIKVETSVVPLSNMSEQSVGDQAKPKLEEVAKVEAHQKVEKLVIKRRVPSPTKMKTRGKQNRLWYLFAKQSKPSKEFVIPPVNKEHKATPTGTLQELTALCKPCSVSLVDISFIMECREVMPGETSAMQSLADQEEVDSISDGDNEPPIIEGIPFPHDAYQTLETSSNCQGVKRKPSPVPAGQQYRSDAKAITMPLSHEESTPVSKKPKLQPGSDYETQYLSFVMKNSAPHPVLDKSVLKSNTPSEGTTKSHTPKPVLTRAPVTARKSMKSAKYTGIRNQSREASPLKATNLTKGSGGLHQEIGQTPPGMSSPGKFACLHCPYTSNVRSVMLEHVYIHTDFVPYACGHCNEAYGSRNGVVIHTKREHPRVVPDIVKNTEICEEDYYITCDTSKRTASDLLQQSTATIHNPLSAAMEPSATVATSLLSDGKSVSLLNPAVLTAQVAATKVGLAASPSVTNAPVQLVVSTSRPTSTAPIVNVVGQVDPSVSGLQVLAPLKTVPGKEHFVVGGSDGGKKSRIPRRPRIPLLVNVDPSQPYYQCRHCTFANNNLGSIRTHVETQHKGEQCYQCHRCELVFFKNSMAMEKHYVKHHPGEPVGYALQADFDVHQDSGDKAKAIHESAMGLQTRGQSPLHVIVSPDGVTLLGATEVSPASSMASPQMSPPMVRALTSPGPAHCRPNPVLSPPSVYPPGQGPTPPPAHSGSPAMSPHSQPYSKPGPACSKSSRVILKVPTISPPQRSAAQAHHTKSAAAHSSHDHGKRPLQSPIGSTHSLVSGTSGEMVDILNLTTSSSCPSPGLDLSKKPEEEPPEDSTTVDEDAASEVISTDKQITADDSQAEVIGTEICLLVSSPDAAMPTADITNEIHSIGPGDSPPPLMIMNVMSLAGQTDSELHPDKCVDSIDNQVPSQDEAQSAEIYTCTTCDATFTELDSVIGHVGDEHKLQYWYACPYCPFGCSWSKMLQHICRAHSDQPSDVPINIIDEEKYFIRSQTTPKQSEPNLNSQSSCNSQADVDEELDIESEQAKENADSTRSPDANNVTGEEKASEETCDEVTTAVNEPKTSEKGCSTDDIPCKQPPAPSRVVQLDEEDIVIVAEHRKQRPVGQIRPTMVRAPSAVPGFRRLGPSGNFQQQVQAVSPITISPTKPDKPAVADLDMDCENIAEQPRHEEVTEDDDIIVTETQSSVITIPDMDQPLDLHQPKQSTSGQTVIDEPTDLSVSRNSSRQSTGDEPQDLSLTAHNLSTGSANFSRSSSSSPSVIKSPVVQPRPGGSRDSSAIRSPPPAHQPAQRSVPPLVIEPIPSLPGARPWGTPITIAPLPQTSPKDNHAGTRQPLPAHTHNRSPRGSVLSAHAGAPSLPSTHRPVTSSSHKGASTNATHRSSTPHRPVSKTMPPLIPISQQSEKGNSKPPPAVHVSSSHGTVKSAKNSSSVIQALPGSNQQSALTSLEQMTKRSGSDLGKRPHSSLSKKLVDNQFADEEAAKKAYSVFNLKPRMHHPKSAAVGSTHQTQQTFGAMGINKWQQFQSQNRPQVRPQLQQPPRPSFPGSQPGSLGMAAAAFQQAYMKRSGVNPAQVAGLPQMSSATAAAAAASFMQRQPSSATNQGFATAAKTPNIQCPYCQFTAEDADTIHNHILSHAPNIQWSCPYCPLPNRMTKASVTKHMQNCHPKNNVVYIPYGVPLM